MQAIVEILAVNDVQRGKSKVSGKDYELQSAECVLHLAGKSPQVGVLMLPRELVDKNVQPGKYSAEFALRVDYRNRQIGSEVISLSPLRPAPAAASKAV